MSMLSQEEIEKLLMNNNLSESEDSGETNSPVLSSEEIDMLGEIGNISIGSSATALHDMLGKKVTITTPTVSVSTPRIVAAQYETPCVAIEIEYTKGVIGKSVFILSEESVKKIRAILTSEDIEEAIQQPIDSFDLSAISEVFNQMMGSSATSLGSMLNKVVDITPPAAYAVDLEVDATIFGEPDENIVNIEFHMIIEDVLDSYLMLYMSYDLAKSMTKEFSASQHAHQGATGAGAMPTQPSVTQEQRMATASPSPQQDVRPVDLSGNHNVVAGKYVDVAPVQLPSFNSPATVAVPENIDLLLDVPLEMCVELGRIKWNIKEVLDITNGTVVILDKRAGENVDILVNGKCIAQGEVVVVDDAFAVRITDIVSRNKRL